jgi:hypothetical protein
MSSYNVHIMPQARKDLDAQAYVNRLREDRVDV